MRLLKYAIVAGLFITLGPATLRYLFANNDYDGNIPVGRGLPIAPGAIQNKKVSNLHYSPCYSPIGSKILTLNSTILN